MLEKKKTLVKALIMDTSWRLYTLHYLNTIAGIVNKLSNSPENMEKFTWVPPWVNVVFEWSSSEPSPSPPALTTLGAIEISSTKALCRFSVTMDRGVTRATWDRDDTSYHDAISQHTAQLNNRYALGSMYSIYSKYPKYSLIIAISLAYSRVILPFSRVRSPD